MRQVEIFLIKTNTFLKKIMNTALIHLFKIEIINHTNININNMLPFSISSSDVFELPPHGGKFTENYRSL